MKVRIEPRHILAGERDSCTTCPVGLALEDAMPQAQWHVDEFHILQLEGWYADPTGQYCRIPLRKFRTPERVVGFVKAWDMGLRVVPIEFDLDVDSDPEETVQ